MLKLKDLIMKNLMKIIAGLIITSCVCFIFWGVNTTTNKKPGIGTPSINYSNSSRPAASDMPKDFINFILNWGYTPGEPQKWVLANLSKYKKDLKFNGVHTYANDNFYYGKITGSLESDAIDNEKNLFDSVSADGLKGVYERVKLSNMCSAQRVEYEVTQSTGSHNINDGFCYTGRDNNTCSYLESDKDPATNKTISGVLKSEKNTNKPGYIAKNIFENMQHSDIFEWQWNDAIDWKIRPMLRINTSDFNSESEEVAAAIITYNYKNKRIDSTIIKVKNFADSSGKYSGGYIDLYKDINITVNGKQETGKLNEGYRYLNPSDGIIIKDCAVDFKVYWFGKVDMWFDKMTVESETAEKLFKGDYDYQIDEELTAYDRNNLNAYTLFVDELTYSNLPCTKYVYDYIRMHYPNSSAHLSCAMTNGNNVRGIREYNSESQTLKKYFSDIQPEIFTVDAHEVSWGNYIPSSFITAQNYESYRIPSTWKVSNDEYNEYLQMRVLGDKSEATGRTSDADYSYYTDRKKPQPQGSFIYQVRKARDLSNTYSPGAKMIIQPQLHSILFEDYPRAIGSTTFDDYGNREPTNEEIQAEAMVSISHGVDGLCWFVYGSISWQDKDKTTYLYGFTQPNSVEPRLKNMFGQNKWEYIAGMNQKILNWKPTLDKINWKEGYSVHSEGAQHNFINDIQSYYRNSSLSYTNEDAIKYWEMGFFNPSDANDKAKYLMIVNRRCVPETSAGVGDYRQLKIKFNAANLQGFNNWKIIDVNTNQAIITIDKNSGIYYNLGEYKPGEGKLYKLEPVN